jgi:hypothetical protein
MSIHLRDTFGSYKSRILFILLLSYTRTVGFNYSFCVASKFQKSSNFKKYRKK